MCLSVAVIALMLSIKLEAYGIEHGYHVSNFDAPPTVNFNEIFTNSLALLSDEPTLTTGTKDEDFHLTNMPSQFVEFRPVTPEVTTTRTPPPPIYILNSSYLKKDNETENTQNVSSTTTTESFTSKRPENSSVKVSLQKHQRGVLDLLLPAARVKSFKGVFDTFKRLLSHTFRKR